MWRTIGKGNRKATEKPKISSKWKNFDTIGGGGGGGGGGGESREEDSERLGVGSKFRETLRNMV